MLSCSFERFAPGLILEKPLWDADRSAFPDRGYCYSRGDWRKDIHAVAVPIRQAKREEPVALNCTLSAFRPSKDTLEKLAAPLLLEAARQIEVACGLH
ncbi:MAG: IclR family transcriptional regulator C-terminal domain-containing protein [Burkholderiaceae bacterium]|nr:IclR family transcriptional regulator C-terminal domain-containing protein [Burkholderiaceae bacterium]